MKRLIATTFLLAFSSFPVTADTITVDTYRGQLEIDSMPETIAVLDMAALDSLQALGVKANGVTNNVYLEYLKSAADGAVGVGSLHEPDMEALNALQVDLIIAGGRSHRAVPDLLKLAPTIDMTIWEDAIGQGMDRLISYGEIFGKQTVAQSLRDNFMNKLESTKTALADKGSALIVMTNGPKVSVYGAGGRFGWLHSALGLTEAVEEVEKATHGEAVSFEFIKNANPDILLVIDRQAAIGKSAGSAKATLDNVLVQETKAWKTGNVVYLSSAPLYIAGGGIQSLNLILDEINDALVN